MATPQSGGVLLRIRESIQRHVEESRAEKETDWTWPGLSARQGRRAGAELCITRVMREQAMGKERSETSRNTQGGVMKRAGI